jgi:DNA-binding IclR family transcriptional regulator
MPIPPSPAVLRACDVLDHLATNPEDAFSVSEVARSVGVPRATCDSVLLALAQRGLVQRDGARRYSLGPACRTLGEAAEVAGAPLSALEPVAEELARATASCAAISSRVRGQTRVERVYDHGPAFGLRARVGESVPLVPPFGAVFVAWDGDAAIDGWLDRARTALGPAERAHFVAALAAARERGFTISVSGEHPDLVRMLHDLAEHTPDGADLDARDALIREISPREYLPIAIAEDGPQRVNQMSAPVFDPAGKVPYALMVLGPSYELSSDEIAALGDRLLDAARLATQRLGGRQP